MYECELGEGGDDVEHMSPVVPKRPRDTDIKGESEGARENGRLIRGQSVGCLQTLNPPKTTVK